jgi:hypothetical protein
MRGRNRVFDERVGVPHSYLRIRGLGLSGTTIIDVGLVWRGHRRSLQWARHPRTLRHAHGTAAERGSSGLSAVEQHHLRLAR